MTLTIFQSFGQWWDSFLSFFGLFWNAHWIVKTVLGGLLLCSLWVWTIVVDKTRLFSSLRRAADRFDQAYSSCQSLGDFYNLYKSLAADPDAAVPGHSIGGVFVTTMAEYARSIEGHARSLAGLQMRFQKVMDIAIAREVEHMERGLLVLATVGSAGPFIGLFGTVCGIMTSFQSIAASKNTLLAVVAPGIAEALFATAIGLVAAIPATIFYNKFTTDVKLADATAGKLCRRILGDPVAAIRRAQVRGDSYGGEFGDRSVHRPASPPPPRGDERDQRHAFRRRDARVADRVHGLGAADDALDHRRSS